MGYHYTWKFLFKYNTVTFHPSLEQVLSGQETLEKLIQQRKKTFTIAYSDEYLRDNVRHGMEVGLESAKRGGDFKGVSGILSNMSGPRGRVYMTEREHMLRPQRSS